MHRHQFRNFEVKFI